MQHQAKESVEKQLCQMVSSLETYQKRNDEAVARKERELEELKERMNVQMQTKSKQVL